MRRSRERFAGLRNRGVFSWALYDWANSVFATTVMAGFFPVFFKEYWSAGTDAVTSTARLGLANALASAVFLIGAPVLGAIADSGAARKKHLAAFTALGALATAALWFVGEGDWQTAAAVYGLATIGFSGAIVFYDALLKTVSPAERLDEVSAFGYSLGYLGGGVLFSVNVAMTLSPATFGLSGPADAVRLSFLTVAVWWVAFSVPLFRNVAEPPSPGTVASAVASGLRSLVRTFPRLPRTPDGRPLPACLLLLHRRGPHHHPHGRGLRPVARLRGREPDRRTAHHSVRGLPGGVGGRSRGAPIRSENPPSTSAWRPTSWSPSTPIS